MRNTNQGYEKAMWIANFLRVVLTREPKLRFNLDQDTIESLYKEHKAASVAALHYLVSKQPLRDLR